MIDIEKVIYQGNKTLPIGILISHVPFLFEIPVSFGLIGLSKIIK